MAQAEVPVQYHSQIVHESQVEEAILAAQYEVIEVAPHSLLDCYFVVTQRTQSNIRLPSSHDWYISTSRLSAQDRARNHRVLLAYHNGEFSLQGVNAQVLARKALSQKGFLCLEERAVLDANSAQSFLTKDCLVVVSIHSNCHDVCADTILPSKGLVPDVNPSIRVEIVFDETGTTQQKIIEPFVL